MPNKIKNLIADIFLLFSQIAFFTAIITNYIFDTLFPETIFIVVASFLLAMSIIAFIVKAYIEFKN